MRIELAVMTPANEGVKVDREFSRLRAAARRSSPRADRKSEGDPSPQKNRDPTGTIRAREFISWDWRGNTPAKVAYMDTPFQGYGANEVVVDIGDDSDTTTR